MKVILKRIAPLQAGKILAVIYGIFSLIFAPFMILGALFGKDGGIAAALLIVPMMLLYVVLGFIGGVVGAWIYNLVGGWVGGLELEFEREDFQTLPD